LSHYVGLDVSVKSVSICVVDGEGSVLARGDTTSDPDEIASFIAQHAPELERVVHESGILAIWLTRELERRGLPIICIDARLAHKALSGRINKSDPGDAEGLAHLARTGWFSQVHIRSEASERVRVLIGTRERLIRMRKDLESLNQNSWAVFLAMCRADLRIAAMSVHASAEAIEASQSLASLRHRPSQAKVLSTTQRRAMTTKPVTPGGRLTISMVGPSISTTASRSLSPE